MMFQLNPSARLRAVFVARRGDVAARRCAYRAGHDTPIITGDKPMNNKILSFLTALGLAAACLATSSAFAEGTFRVGAFDENGVTVVVARAIESDSAELDYPGQDTGPVASDACDELRTRGGVTYPIAVLDCTVIPTQVAASNSDGNFENECVVIVVAPGVTDNTAVFTDTAYGVGVGPNCAAAMDNADDNCTAGICVDGQNEALPLNDAGDFYVIDGSATACPNGQYNTLAADVGLDCQDAGTSDNCISNNVNLPIFAVTLSDTSRGGCRAANDYVECREHHGFNLRRIGDDTPDDPDNPFGDDRVADDGPGSCNAEVSCGGAEYANREGLCGQCSAIGRAAGSGIRCDEACLPEYEDTGMYIGIDSAGMSVTVTQSHPIAPRHTMCRAIACDVLNRADREEEGGNCGECLPEFNDTNAVVGDRMCVPDETCLGNNDGIPDGTGGCTDPDTTCLAIEGRAETENRVEMGASCICADRYMEQDGVCVLLCEEGQIVNGDRCISFSYFINGNRVTDDLNSDPVEGTEEEPFDIALADVADFSTTVMTPISDSDGNAEDVVYSKAAESEDREQQINDLIEQQSNELIVDSEGVITFDPETFDPDNTDTPVSPGTYNIVIAVNSDEDADIPLDEILLDVVYVTVQAAPVVIPPPPPSVDVEPSPVSESGGADLKIVLGVIGVGAWALYAYYWNVVPQYSWTPSYAFRNDNGNISYSVGSRWTATADNLQFYWQTSQSSASNGDQLVYGSGIKYNNGVFSAVMNSEGDSDETDLDVSLLANKQLGLWQLKGGYNFDMQTSPTETDTQSRFNIAAQYSLNKWVLSTTANTDGDTASARFAARYTVDRWILSATTNTDGDTTSARINYSYRF